MANFFDQFDAPAQSQPDQGSNFFDQFDQAPKKPPANSGQSQGAGSALNQLKNMASDYQSEEGKIAATGDTQMKNAWGSLKSGDLPSAVAQGALGLAGYAGAPIGGAINAVAGMPLERDLGIPHDVTNFGVGLLGPAAAEKGASALSSLADGTAWQKVKNAASNLPGVSMFTDSGAADRADKILKNFAGGDFTPTSGTSQVPGASPTMAQSSQNPGIASLEQTLKNKGAIPGTTNPLSDASQANADAYMNQWQSLRGTPEQINALKAQRDANALPLLDDVKSSTAEADPTQAFKQINKTLSSGEGQMDDVASALNSAKQKMTVPYTPSMRAGDALQPFQDLFSNIKTFSPENQEDLLNVGGIMRDVERGKLDPAEAADNLRDLQDTSLYDDEDDHPSNAIGQPWNNAINKAIKTLENTQETALERSPDQLYGIRRDLMNKYDDAPSTAKPAIIQARNAIDDAIQEAVPSYNSYRQAYAEGSKPITALEYMQQADLTDGKGALSPTKLGNFIKNTKQARQFGSPIDPANSLTDDHMNALQAIHDDMMAEQNVKSLAKNNNLSLQRKSLDKMLPSQSFAGKTMRWAPDAAGALIGSHFGDFVGATGLGSGELASQKLVQPALKAADDRVVNKLTEWMADPSKYADYLNSRPMPRVPTDRDLSLRSLGEAMSAVQAGADQDDQPQRKSGGRVPTAGEWSIMLNKARKKGHDYASKDRNNPEIVRKVSEAIGK